MTGIDSLGTFIIAAIIVIITPGIDTIMVLTRSISLGKKAGLYAAFGVSLGLVIHTIAAAFGLSLILAKSAFAFSIVKYLGAAYLFYLGYKSLTVKTNQAEIKSIEVKNTANKKIFLTALLSDVLNPKIAIFFLAFLPQFIKSSEINNPTPYLILGFIIFMIALVWCSFLALMGSNVATLFNKNKNAESRLNKMTGIVFILLGLKIAFTKR